MKIIESLTIFIIGYLTVGLLVAIFIEYIAKVVIREEELRKDKQTSFLAQIILQSLNYSKTDSSAFLWLLTVSPAVGIGIMMTTSEHVINKIIKKIKR